MKTSKERGLFIFIIALLLFLLPATFYGWHESEDPAFIPNQHYNFIDSWVLTFLTLLALFILFKNYKHNHGVREWLKEYFDLGNWLGNAFILLIAPIFIYLYLSSLILLPIKLWTHYHLGEQWSQEYVLVEVNECTKDYYECVNLTFSDLSTHNEYSIKWFLDNDELLKLKNKKVNLIGEEGYFGYIVNAIQW
ncbi:hypothetical protein [Pseudoalteromonas sp. TB64]|uniref:hypothetical protein n=1 Tax=Pseudoalteromonas sp. TB64 TaxID=1938600 RepID=UPI0003F54D15|nr:hypothetical protein [Pseudoalteromonas sp. TB64]